MGEVTPRVRQIVFDSNDARRAAEFWRQLVGLVYRPGMSRQQQRRTIRPAGTG